jgi:hypothetical protein
MAFVARTKCNPEETSKPLDSQYNQYLPSWNSGEIGTDFQEGEYDGDHEGSKEAPTAGKHLSAKLVVDDEHKPNCIGDDNDDDDNDEVNSLLDDFQRFPQTKPRAPIYLLFTPFSKSHSDLWYL